MFKHDLEFTPVGGTALLRCTVCEEPKRASDVEVCQHCRDVICRGCLAAVLTEHTQCRGGGDGID